MRTAEYLEKCKQVLDLDTDYKLAKVWDIDTSSMSQYFKGKLKPDNYLCFRIAETLHESPTKIIAELESENQRNETKSLYFKRFFSTVGLWITLIVVSSICVTFSDSVGAVGINKKPFKINIMAHYTKWLKTLKTGLRWLANWHFFADTLRVTGHVKAAKRPIIEPSLF